jgi:UDP-glucuronate 4-epimerase
MKVLVTGAAGFIGFHLVQRLLREEFEVVGLDNINDYYDVNLKYARLAETGIYAPEETDRSGGKNRNYPEIAFGEFIQSINNPDYRFIRLNLEDKEGINQLFETEKFDYVVNLAAQAGVRYSIENPDVYIQSNIVGFLNILEASRHNPVKHLVFASSSSVYGANAKIPFSEDDKTDSPVSLYAATKKSNELMAYTYSHLYQIPITGLRFFTVYGPWSRPDMSPMLFANAIVKGEPIKVFNNGDMERDFTYIDDIIEGLFRTIAIKPQNEPTCQIMNIGNGSPVNLLKFIETLENGLGKKAEKVFLPMQPGDVKQTWADTLKLEISIKYKPQTDIQDGANEFANWYNTFFINIKSK